MTKTMSDDPLVDEVTQEEALTRDILELLSEPFPEEAIEWKPQTLYPKENPTRALAAPYITSRHIMNRLDEVVGPANWEYWPNELRRGIRGELTIFGITKCDIGFIEGDDDRAIKGSSSDALKRAAVLFGIGRYLYEADQTWYGWDKKKKEFTEQPRLTFGGKPQPSTPKPQPGPAKAPTPKEPETTRGDPLLQAAMKMGGEISIEPPDGAVTVAKIQHEANRILGVQGLDAHYKGRPHTIQAMGKCGYAETTATYLQENYEQIVRELVERVLEKEQSE